MSVAAVTLVFLVLVVALVLLPIVPALRELRHRIDAHPLPIAADGRVSPFYFAERFRHVLIDRLSGPLEEVRASGRVLRGRIEDGESFVVLPEHHPALRAAADEPLDALVVAAGDLEIEAGQEVLHEVYAGGSLRAADGVTLRATLADGDLWLGEKARCLRWLHGGGDVTIGAGSDLGGRTSAGRRLRIATGTDFGRLHAPRIEFGEPVPVAAIEVQRRDLTDDDLGPRAERGGSRMLVHGDVTLPRATRWTGDLVVRGRLTLGDDAWIEGSVKAHDVLAGENVVVTGSLFARGHVVVGRGGRVDGVLVSERHVELAAGCVIGRDPDTSTLRAEWLDVAPGCVVHGTVWVDRDGGRCGA